MVVKPGPRGDKGVTGPTGPIGPTGPTDKYSENFIYDLVNEDITNVSNGSTLIFDDMSPIITRLKTNEIMDVFMFNITNESRNNITIEGSDVMDINGAETISIQPNSISWITAKKIENETYTTMVFTPTIS